VGKLELGSRFRGRWAKIKNKKKLLGGGYNLAIAKGERENKDNRALEHPWAKIQ